MSASPNDFLCLYNSALSQQNSVKSLTLPAINETAFNNFYVAISKANRASPPRYKLDLSTFLSDNINKILNIYQLLHNTTFSILSSLINTTPTQLVRYLENYTIIKQPFLSLFNKTLTKDKLNLKIPTLLEICQNFSAFSALNQLIEKQLNNPTDFSNFNKQIIETINSHPISSLEISKQILIPQIETLFQIKIHQHPEAKIFQNIAHLAIALNRIKKNYYEQLFHGIIKTYLVGDNYHAFCHASNQSSEIGTKLSLHNSKIRETLSAKGIDVPLAFNYKRKTSFHYGSNHNQEITKCTQQLASLIARLVSAINNTNINSKTENRIRTIKKAINNLCTQLTKGINGKALITQQKPAKTVLDRLQKQTNINIIKKIIKLALNTEDKNIIETASKINQIIAFIQDLKRLQETATEKTKTFYITQWDKKRFDTFLLGNKLSCCLATTGSAFPAIIQRWADDALFFHVVVDKATNEPVCGAWLYYAQNQNNLDEIFVVANFLEIRVSYAKDKKLMDTLVSHLLKYIGDYTKTINASQFLIAPLNYGSIESCCYFELKGSLSLKKVGNDFTYHSAEQQAQSYYLKSIKSKLFNLYDERALQEKFAEHLSATKSQLKFSVDDNIADYHKQYILAEQQKNQDTLGLITPYLRTSFEFMLEATKENCHRLQYACPELKNDADFMLAAGKQDWRTIQYASIELKNNIDFMHRVTRQNWQSIKYASDELKNNANAMFIAWQISIYSINYASEELRNSAEFMLRVIREDSDGINYLGCKLKNDAVFMLKLLQENWLAVGYASNNLKNNIVFMRAACKQQWRVVRYASAKLKNNMFFMLTIVKLNWQAINYASDELKDNAQFMLAAINLYWLALNHASNNLKYNVNFVFAAVKQNQLKLVTTTIKGDSNNVKALSDVQQNWRALATANCDHKNNIAIVLTALRQSGRALEFASDELKNNKAVVLAAAMQDLLALDYASDELKNDANFMLIACKLNWAAIQYASNSLKNNIVFMRAACKQQWRVVRYASAKLKNNMFFMLTAISQSTNALEYSSTGLRNNARFMFFVIKQNFEAIEYIGCDLMNNAEFMLTIVKLNWQAINYASDELKDNAQFMLAAINLYWLALNHASNNLKYNVNFVFAAVKQNQLKLVTTTIKGDSNNVKALSDVQQNWRALATANCDHKNNIAIVLTALRQSGRALEFASDELKNNKAVVLAAAMQDLLALDYASDELKNDAEFMVTIIRYDSRAFAYASDELKNNAEFLAKINKCDNQALEHTSDKSKSSHGFLQAIEKPIELPISPRITTPASKRHGGFFHSQTNNRQGQSCSACMIL